jgi:hypothetical protein
MARHAKRRINFARTRRIREGRKGGKIGLGGAPAMADPERRSWHRQRGEKETADSALTLDDDGNKGADGEEESEAKLWASAIKKWWGRAGTASLAATVREHGRAAATATAASGERQNGEDGDRGEARLLV